MSDYFVAGIPTLVLRSRAGGDEEETIESLEKGGVPVSVSRPADDLAEEFGGIHPPAHVMRWYAKEIASWLTEQQLIPGGASP
ncbi:MAG: hypothetical protein M5R36_17025 [Deltaproteobacteria bacterium]|nr:hypothetical protein [Deltaproteobacteria bacterium]